MVDEWVFGRNSLQSLRAMNEKAPSSIREERGRGTKMRRSNNERRRMTEEAMVIASW